MVRRADAHAATAILLTLAMGAPGLCAGEQRPDGALLPRLSLDAAIFRGSLVYANYCVTCHGSNQDGNGRAARLHTPRPANLRASDKNNLYLEMIIRRGGEAMGRSPRMPPWAEELTDEQIGDLVSFIRSVNQNQAP